MFDQLCRSFHNGVTFLLKIRCACKVNTIVVTRRETRRTNGNQPQSTSLSTKDSG